MIKKFTGFRLQVVVYIFLFFLLTLTCTLSTSFAHSQTVIVEMTSEGFKPNSVTLDENFTVIFLNRDSKPHWPASDVHPTHDIYPQFDPQSPIESGKSWAFKPKKAGEWKYHDHLNPHRGGTLKVIAETGSQDMVTNSRTNIVSDWVQNLKNAIQTVIANLKNIFGPKVVLDSGKFVKSSPVDQIALLKKYADSQGAEKVWQFVKDTYQGQAGSSGNIHDLAHLAGGLLFEKMGFAGLGKCSANFAFGCYHGFLDEAFAKSIEKLEAAHQACLKLDFNLSGPVASCLHGIGHGVASFFSVTDLKKALSTCRKLESGSEYCFDGVLMEFARNAPESYIKKDDPLYPCDSLEKDFGYAYSSACGRNQPSLLLGRFKMNFEQVIPVCLSSPSAPFKESCIDSLGFSLASSQDSEKIIQGCQMMGDREYIKRCIQAAAGELVFQDVLGWEQKSKAVCESFPDNLNECLSYVNKLAADYHRVRK